MSQSFHVAEQFTGLKGKYVPLKETLRGFKMILDGECDDLPESAFLMVGTIDEAFEKVWQPSICRSCPWMALNMTGMWKELRFAR